MTTQQATIRMTQAPLKESYRADPSRAQVTLKTSGTLDSHSITCALGGENAANIRDAHRKVAGLHPMAGGPEAGISGELCSGDMLLEALVACAGVTLKAVATALGVPLAGGEVRAEGDLDFRGTLGVDRDAPVGFTAIRLAFDLRMEPGRPKVEQATIERLGRLTERYCVVLQTIAKRPQLEVRVDGRTASEEGGEGGEEEAMVSWKEVMPQA